MCVLVHLATLNYLSFRSIRCHFRSVFGMFYTPCRVTHKLNIVLCLCSCFTVDLALFLHKRFRDEKNFEGIWGRILWFQPGHFGDGLCWSIDSSAWDTSLNDWTHIGKRHLHHYNFLKTQRVPSLMHLRSVRRAHNIVAFTMTFEEPQGCPKPHLKTPWIILWTTGFPSLWMQMRVPRHVVQHVSHGRLRHSKHVRRRRRVCPGRGGGGHVQAGGHVQLFLLYDLVPFLHMLTLFGTTVLEPYLYLEIE